MKATFRRLWEDWKAKRRGEVRVVHKSVTRGRIYARVGEDAPAPTDPVPVPARGTARVHITVTRADGTIEDLGSTEASMEWQPSKPQSVITQ